MYMEGPNTEESDEVSPILTPAGAAAAGVGDFCEVLGEEERVAEVAQ